MRKDITEHFPPPLQSLNTCRTGLKNHERKRIGRLTGINLSLQNVPTNGLRGGHFRFVIKNMRSYLGCVSKITKAHFHRLSLHIFVKKPRSSTTASAFFASICKLIQQNCIFQTLETHPGQMNESNPIIIKQSWKKGKR